MKIQVVRVLLTAAVSLRKACDMSRACRPTLLSPISPSIRGSQAIKNGDEVIGKQTKVKVVKNKVAPPFRRAEFDIMFGEGISRAGEIIDLGAELGIIKKSGSWFSYNETKIAQGRDAAKQVILDNPELAEELEGLIFAELRKDK